MKNAKAKRRRSFMVWLIPVVFLFLLIIGVMVAVISAMPRTPQRAILVLQLPDRGDEVVDAALEPLQLLFHRGLAAVVHAANIEPPATSGQTRSRHRQLRASGARGCTITRAGSDIPALLHTRRLLPVTPES